MADSISDKKLTFEEFPPVSREEWEEVIKNDLKGKHYRLELKWNSPDGFDLLPFYRRDDLEDLVHSTEPVVHSANWHVLEVLDVQDIQHANKQALIALQNGASGLYIDIPHSQFHTENDLENLLNDVLIDVIPVHFSRQSSSQKTYQWMKNYTEKKGFEFENLNVFFTFDPFADALATGKLSEKREIISRLYDLHQPFSAYAVNASVPGESGATIIQQVAYALAAGNEYLNFREVSGADMVEMAAKIHFRFNVAGSYFPEIAKFRAFRLLWEQILNAYDSNLAGNADTHIHASTAKWNKPRRDAYNNMIRSTTEAMSAAIGGCNHISVERFDKNWAPHSEFASRIARNSQLILQHESYLNKVADVGAGSYYVEKLTDEIALKSWELFQDIEKEGGLYEAVKSGWIQNLINEAKSRKIEAFRDKDEVIVGLNKYEPEESTEPLSDVGFSTADSLFEGDFEAVDSLSPFNIQQELK